MDEPTETPVARTLTNRRVAQLLDLTHSGVSRIRSGDRLPSIDLMSTIAKVLDWPVNEQFAARDKGRDAYKTGFEEAVRRYAENHPDVEPDGDATGAAVPA
jgi:transcriptional regulator with XRE-family HTH domain